LRESWQGIPTNETERALLLEITDRLWRKEIRRRGLEFFSREVLGFDNAEHQREWYDVLDNKALRKIALAAPRGHTKTTCFSVNYPLSRIDEDHNVRLLLVSNAAPQSEGFLREIVANIERNQAYVDYAGQLKPQKPEKWTNREIIVDRSKYDMKDPTISTVGVGGTILSKRADEIICDDLLNPENTKTQEQRAKIKEWFFQVLLPVLAPGGRVIFVGTVWQNNDLLSEILEDPMWDYRKKFKAVIDEPAHPELWEEWYAKRFAGTPESQAAAAAFLRENDAAMHEGVHVLWPKVFPYEVLYPLKRANRVAFEKAYQNNIVSREDQKFKEEWLERAKERGANLRLVHTLSQDQRKEFKIVTAGNDLAAGEKEQDDDNALLTLGLRRLDDMVQVLSLDRGKFSPAEWRKTMVERFDGLAHDRIIVESNGYQIAIKRDLADKNLPVVAFNTGGEKLDPYIGVESLAILFENDRVILPYDKSDPTTIALIDQLVDELRQFPIGHTGDSAMALWFAYTAMRDLSAASGTSGFLQMIAGDVARIKDGTTPNNNLATWKAMAGGKKK